MQVTNHRPVLAGVKRTLGSPKVFERGMNALAALILVLAMLSGIGGMYEVGFRADLGSTNGFLLALFKALGGTMLLFIVVHLALRQEDPAPIDYGMTGLSDDGTDVDPPPLRMHQQERRPRVRNIRGDQD
jgi:hypothetical protein